MKKSIIILIILLSLHPRVSEFATAKLKELKGEDNNLEKAIEVIKYYETLSITPIKDNGLFYVGYGTETNDSISSVTEEQANNLLIEVLEDNSVRLIKDINIETKFFELAVILSYNIGAGNVLKSKFWNLVKTNGPDKDIEKEFMEFCIINNKKHANLLKRRIAEFNIYK